jgi:putative transposase
MKEDQRIPNRRHPVHHAFIEGHNKTVIIFLTVCTHQRKMVLASDAMHQSLLTAWKSAQQWCVGRYVIMPDHIHLFCSPASRESENVAKWAAYWRRRVTITHPDLKPLWQRDCWDTQLRNHESYSEKWAYVRNNPIRAGLVKDPDAWPYQGQVRDLVW